MTGPKNEHGASSKTWIECVTGTKQHMEPDVESKVRWGSGALELFDENLGSLHIWGGDSVGLASTEEGNEVGSREWLFHQVLVGCLGGDEAFSPLSPTTCTGGSLEAMAVDYWISDRGWNWEHVSMYLPASTLMHMASVLSNSSEEGDRLTWKDSPYVLFSVPSAYMSTCEYEVIMPLKGWDHIWKLKVQKHVWMFIKLLAEAGYGGHPSMQPLSLAQEDSLHAIRECKDEMDIWLHAGPHIFKQKFLSLGLGGWKLWNLMVTSIHSHDNHWRIRFILTCLWIWRWRNKKIFSEAIVCWNQKVTYLKRCLEETLWIWRKLDELQKKLPYNHEVFIGWKHLDYQKIKINTNSAAKGNLGLASAVSVLRDAHKWWIVGTIRSQGIMTSVNVELQAITMGCLWNGRVGSRM